jgi:hypothetical protein
MKFYTSKARTLVCNVKDCITQQAPIGCQFHIAISCYHVLCDRHVPCTKKCPVCGSRTDVEALEIVQDYRLRKDREELLDAFIDFVDTVVIRETQLCSTIKSNNRPPTLSHVRRRQIQ